MNALSAPILPFEEAVLDVSGGNKKVQKGDYLAIGAHPIVDQGQEPIGGYSNDEADLVAGRGPWVIFGDHTRSLKFMDRPFCMGADGVKVLVPKHPDRLDARYLYWFLVAHEVPSAGYSRHYKFLKRLHVPLPPLDEQRRIAAILDKADALRQKRKRATALLDSLTQSIFLEMFGEGLLPEDGTSTIAAACVKITDGTHHSPKTLESGIPYVTAKHLRPTGLDFDSDPWFVSAGDHDAIYSRCNPEYEDVLYIKDGATTGIAAVNPYRFPFSMLSSLALLKPDRTVCLPQYLSAWLNSPTIKSHMIGSMAGAGTACRWP